jgi:hypothetical protein
MSVTMVATTNIATMPIAHMTIPCSLPSDFVWQNRAPRDAPE